jgi:hypothetical protein
MREAISVIAKPDSSIASFVAAPLSWRLIDVSDVRWREDILDVILPTSL